MLSKTIGALALIAVAGCGQSMADPNQPQVLAGKYVDDMLKQCSRSTPPKGEGTWMPDRRDINALEAKLIIELARRLRQAPWASKEELAQIPTFPSGFRRQYGGIVRGGRKYIYGNFSPRRTFEDIADANGRIPFIVCDGGPAFFGAEYDVKARRFTHWDFNGEA